MGGWAAYRLTAKAKRNPAKGNPGFYCLPHTGQIPPYGDNPDDVPYIKAGMSYYDRMYGKRGY